VYLGFSQINIHAYMSTLFESFEVIPAVDMQDGDVVQLVQGERGQRHDMAILLSQQSNGLRLVPRHFISLIWMVLLRVTE